MTEPVVIEATPAATLVLVRDRAAGPPELLMIERAATMSFAAGALVFPGGRIEPQDHALADDAAAPDRDEAAARIAAIRETLEEVGIAVGVVPPPDPATTEALRNGLAQGEGFAALLARFGLGLDLAALCPLARWRPPVGPYRVFDTRFYLARAPEGGIAAADGGESVRAVWTTATAALADADAGLHHIIFPTRRNLERLAQAAAFEHACADAARHPISIISPRVEHRDGEAWLCIPDGAGYPVTAQRLDEVQRG